MFTLAGVSKGKQIRHSFFFIYTYGIVGTERVESVGAAHKQATGPTEEHLHEIPTFVLHGDKNKTKALQLTQVHFYGTESLLGHALSRSRTTFLMPVNVLLQKCLLFSSSSVNVKQEPSGF